MFSSFAARSASFVGLILWFAAVGGATVEAADDALIVISDPSPPDEAKRGSLNPRLSVTVAHRGGKPMDIRFRSDASGPWQDIGGFSQVGGGRYSVTPKGMIRRGETYHWEVTATDGSTTASRRFALELVYQFGDGRQVITQADCWKYGYIRHGWEKGKFFVTVQRGMWAAYDLDQGWYKTYQRLLQRKSTTGSTGGLPHHLDDGGNLGHPFWGYWDGTYHALGIGWRGADSRTFEGFQKLVEEDAVHDVASPCEQREPEGSTYTFSENRAWIMANAAQKARYWEWTKEAGWKPPVIVGDVSTPASNQVALLRHNRSTWYLYVIEGESSPSYQTTSATLKFFKSADGGRTWGPLQDTGIPAHGHWSHVSFARYGNNYYVFLSRDQNAFVCYSKDGEHWLKETIRTVAPGMWMKPHGTLLHQSALISTVNPSRTYVDEQYGIITLIPELLAQPAAPTRPSPAGGAVLKPGTTQAELAVEVHGPQTYDVAFYWADGTFLGEDKLLQEGQIARLPVRGLAPRKTYQWYAIARGAGLEYCGNEPDTTSDERQSEVFRFSVGP